MNIIQYAFSSKYAEVDKEEFIFQNGVSQSQNASLSFLKKIKKLRGKAFLIGQCLTQNQNSGKNCLHYAA